jgi:F420H2 dehydrogenase subunit N
VISGNLWVMVPMICLAVGAFGIYLFARLVSSRNELLAAGTTVVLALALISLIWLVRDPAVAGSELAWGNFAAGGVVMRTRPIGALVSGIALAMGVCVAFYSGRYLSLDRRYTTYYSLLLLVILGLVGMVTAEDLFTLYLFTELMSISTYVLVALRRHTDTAVEAGFKYLIIGSTGTITMLMGIALIYRATGTTAIVPPSAPNVWTRAGLACLWTGLGVKSAIVPGHTWLPDAYGRAPSSVNALSSAALIQAPLYVLIRTSLTLGMTAQEVGLALIVLSFANMTVGNVMALVQTNVKRMLGYSTIAQMGYAMFILGVGLRNGQPEAIRAGLFLIVVHAVMKGLAFLSKGACHFYHRTTTIADMRGVARRLPLPAVTFAISLVGLASVPPLAGFSAKWFLLSRAIQPGDVLTMVGLVLVLVNTVVSLGYYLPLMVTLFAPGRADAPSTGAAGVPARGGLLGGQHTQVAISLWMVIPLLVLTFLVVWIGLQPDPWWRLIAAVEVF